MSWCAFVGFGGEGENFREGTGAGDGLFSPDKIRVQKVYMLNSKSMENAFCSHALHVKET